MTPAQERALAALVDAFVPGGDGLPPASALGVHRLLRAEVEALGRPAFVKELDLLLSLVESPLASAALAGRPARFSALPPDAREAYLRALAGSALPLKRKAFTSLRLLVLLYAYGMEGSPYQRLAGYVPAPLDPPAPPDGLAVRRAAPGERLEADAIVVGSGAGGGVAAASLARAGKRVVVLERARYVPEAAFTGRELEGIAAMFVDRGLAATDDRGIALRAGSALGGGTLVNWSTSLRLPAPIREEWRSAGVGDDLDPHYAAVEERLDVDTDESPRNGVNAALERGLRALGIDATTVARNVRGCGDCGPCAVGCRRGAKRSTPRTYLVDACAAGAEILDGADVRRILVDGGRVTGVVARVAGGEIEVRAPLVALAGGSLYSPALLLRSGIATARAGRGLYLHPVAAVAGVYRERVESWRGVPQAVMSEAFAGDGASGFRIEAAPAHPGLIASGVPWWGAAEHRARMAEAAHFAPFIAIVRDREPGRVDLDADGEPRVRYTPGGRERDLLRRGMVELARLHRAAGARRISTLHTPPLEHEEGGDFDAFLAEIERRAVAPGRVLLFSAHQMGTCRIGTSPGTSVADPDGRVRGVRGLSVTDASAFPSASGVNPMLTIMALAGRTAERML